MVDTIVKKYTPSERRLEVKPSAQPRYRVKKVYEFERKVVTLDPQISRKKYLRA